MKTENRKWKRRGKKRPGLTRRDGLMLAAMVTGLVAAVMLGMHMAGVSQQRKELARQLRHWRTEYRLTETQVAQIRAIEEAFHGSGSPFASGRSAAETQEHFRKIAAVMGEEAGQRFLQAMEGGGGSSQWAEAGSQRPEESSQ